MSWNTAALM
ncbi:hypothetical protein CGLO_13202 [Colletotrichum gloeosporioides Cg-14]|uniref:Uncharacterized protein n=1 Tax=Colletotrichum gloeosporioides (strain Cg-14) TaxID=1237896 RepID=T0L7M1_COLGC|nr:hypothetical protein CGLO_13202 [Colletotrichum gloeosporioides Cg-14]